MTRTALALFVLSFSTPALAGGVDCFGCATGDGDYTMASWDSNTNSVAGTAVVPVASVSGAPLSAGTLALGLFGLFAAGALRTREDDALDA